MTNTQAVELARAYLGSGASTFYSYYSKHFSTFKSGDWCACFVSCILSMAGATAPGFPGLYCPTMCKAAKKAGATVPVSQAKPGDVVFFNWDRNDNADHVGICQGVDVKRKLITTIDGNVSNRVGRRTRKWSEVMTIIRPTYKGGESYMNMVKALQEFLQSKDYYKGYRIDGDFGTYTIIALQQYLAYLGYYNSRIDGDFGEFSRKAYLAALKSGKF